MIDRKTVVPKTDSSFDQFLDQVNAVLGEIDYLAADERRCLPPQTFLRLASIGLFGVRAPTASGGLGLGLSECLQIIRIFGTHDIGLGIVTFLHNLLALPCLEANENGLPDEIYREAVRGDRLLAFALTEQGSGSDPLRIRTVANKKCDQWVLSGEKIWSGLAAWATDVVVCARLDDGEMGLFLVPSHAVGVRHLGEHLTMGLRGVMQGAITFDAVAIDCRRALVTSRHGWRIAKERTMAGRLGLAAISAGALERSNKIALTFAQNRSLRRGRLVEHESAKIRMTRMLATSRTLDCLNAHCVRLVTHGSAALRESACIVAKIFASEEGFSAVDDAVQIMGGRGCDETRTVSRVFRDLRVFRIFEGTTEALLDYVGRLVFVLSDEDFSVLFHPADQLALRKFLDAHRNHRRSRYSSLHENIGWVVVYAAALASLRTTPINDASHRLAIDWCAKRFTAAQQHLRDINLGRNSCLLTDALEKYTCEAPQSGFYLPAFREWTI